jgi:uncharacterized protein
MSAPAPGIPADELTADFWTGTRAGELRIQRCRNCGTYIHLPRPICRSCQSFDLGWEKVSGRGTIYSFTLTTRAFHPYFVDRVPYIVATIALDEQPQLHFLSNIVGTDPDSVRIGQRVRVQFEDRGEYSLPVFAIEEESK